MKLELTSFYSKICAIGVILVVGFFLGKLKLISDKTNRELTNLLLTIFMPASLLVAFPTTYDSALAEFFFSGLFAGAIVIVALIIISRLIFNRRWTRRELRLESQFALIFNNATFLGYPIIVNTFNLDGILAYCGFIVIFNIALFSYGIWLFEQKLSFSLIKKVIFNPNIIAVLLGMIVFLTSFSLPKPLIDAVSYVGNATTPLSLICIGYMLSQAKLLKTFAKWRLILAAAIQLLIGPLITWSILKLCQFPLEVVYVCTLIQSLPTATSLGLFATKYGGNISESSELVVISTLLSAITMPLMTFFLLR
ncbi:MAG: AEC family transporter [Candidatus Saccharibacteria bacterium]|nr:AEC family transporter [Candidatus Saccharibacteria bacterium]